MSDKHIRRFLPPLLLAAGILALFFCGSRVLWRVIPHTPYDRLMDAIERGDIGAVRAELDKGTDPNRLPPPTEEPVAPICAAASDGKVEIVRLLLDRGAHIDRGDGWDFTPLEAAATNNQIAVMELLVSRGAVVNDFGDGKNSYSLWRAAVDGKVSAVKWLLAHGANPNTVTNDGTRLLPVVEDFGQMPVAAELRRAGAR
jgi:ankyrin repeat protein